VDIQEAERLTKPEITGVRDLRYSLWHRTIGPEVYATDLDFIEWRNGRGVVALIEAKQGRGRLSDFQRKVFCELSQRAKIPFYVVRYDETMTRFTVMRLPDNYADELSKEEYVDWLKKL
jgi:hypothetical protein